MSDRSLSSVFIMRQVQKRYKKEDFIPHTVFVDLELQGYLKF